MLSWATQMVIPEKMLQQEQGHLPVPPHLLSRTKPSPVLQQGNWAFLLSFLPCSCISTGTKITQQKNNLLHNIESHKKALQHRENPDPAAKAASSKNLGHTRVSHG